MKNLLKRFRYWLLSLILTREEKDVMEEAILSVIDYKSYELTHECSFYTATYKVEEMETLCALHLSITTDRDYLLSPLNTNNLIQNAKAKFLR